MERLVELPKVEADEYLEEIYGIKSKEIEEICGRERSVFVSKFFSTLLSG